MRFTLKYSGTDLLSAGNASRRKHEKQLLRQHFHGQLSRIWQDDNVLRHVVRKSLAAPIKVQDRYDLPRPIGNTNPAIAGFLFRAQIWESVFVPLIPGPMEAYCHLALRVGRPVKPGSIIFTGGDLDGRLKTLFDALAIPKDKDAVDAKDVTQEEYVCLLSDDELITGLSVESYRLLESNKQDENYIDLDIEVTITAMTPMYGTMSLLYG